MSQKKNASPIIRRIASGGIKSLSFFDGEMSSVFVNLSLAGQQLAMNMSDDMSGSEILEAIEDNNGGSKFRGKVLSLIKQVRTYLDQFRMLLLQLLESQDNLLNELASSLVFVSETGSVAEQRASVLIVDALFRWEGIDLSQFEKGDASVTVKFASLLRIVLSKNTERLCLTAASRALGRLARICDPASRVDFVRFETVRAMEWLHLDAHAGRRLSAVLILRYLTEMVPMVFVTHEHTVSFFDRVGSALLDSSPQTRYAATDAIRAFFALINTREDQELCFRKCYSIVHRGIERIHTPESIHGSLLAVGELLRNPNDLIRPVFVSLCSEILRFRSHPNSLVVRAVVNLVPLLVSFSPDFASTPQMQIALDMLLQKAKPGTDPILTESALKSLGLLVSKSDRSVFLNDLPRVISVVREGLKNPNVANTALVCLCNLAKIMGEDLLGESLSLLDDAFAYPAGLTCTTELLCSLEAFMPILGARPLIRARLIHEISIVLTGKPFSPPPLLNPFSEEEDDLYFFIKVLHRPSGKKQVVTVSSIDLQREALKALGEFDFGPLSLLPFLRQRIAPYLQSSLRKDACLACVKTVSKSHQISAARSQPIIQEIVRGILLIASGDSDPALRVFAMDLVKDNAHIFGKFLAQGWSLQMIFTSLNDSKFSVRKTAIEIVSSLAPENAGVILPFLRKFVISLVGASKSSMSKREENENAVLMECLIRGLYSSSARELGDVLLGPFMEPLIKELLLKIKQSNQPTALMQTLAALCLSGDPILEKHLLEAIPIIVEYVVDSSTSQQLRQSALSTLTALLKRTESIGDMKNRKLIEPLLEIASAPPNSVYSWSLQREALRGLGTIGALDPAVQNQYLRSESSQNNPSNQNDDFGLNLLAVGKPSKKANRENEDLFSLEGFEENGDIFDDEEHISEDSQNNLVPDDAASDSSSDQSDSEENFLPVRGSVAEYGSSTQEQLEEHFRLVAVQALTKILKTSSLSSFHAHVVEAAGNTSRSLGIDTVPYLSKLVPAIIRVAAAPKCDLELRRTALKQLTVFISVMKKQMRPYIKQVLHLVRMFWDENIFEALSLVEESYNALKEEFSIYVGWVVPKLITALRQATDKNVSRLIPTRKDEMNGNGNLKRSSSDPAKPLPKQESRSSLSDEAVSRRALGTVQYLGLWISEPEHSHRVATEILRILDTKAISDLTKTRALEVLRSLCQHDAFNMDLLPIVQSAVSILASSQESQALFVPALDLLSTIVERSYSSEFSLEPFFNTLPEKFRARLEKKRSFVVNHRAGEDADTEDGNSVSTAGSVEERGNELIMTTMITEVSKSRSNSMASAQSDKNNADTETNGGSVSLTVNPQKLKEAFECSQATTEDDWSEWMRRFAVELLRESPDPTLRACASVAQAHTPLARDLFNAAFVSCWTRLSEEDRNFLVKTLKTVFRHKNTPPDVLHLLLNLCEFMEHNDRPLPIERLSDFAIRCHAYAKALHYKEMEFRTSKSSVIVDDLIGINHRLERHEAAQGLLRIAQNQEITSSQHASTPLLLRKRGSVNAIMVQVRETWYEQLGRWRDALESYESKLLQLPSSEEVPSSNTRIDLTLGMMRCMLSLGEYDRLYDVGKRNWDVFDVATKKKVAPLMAHALWEKGAESLEMESYLKYVDVTKLDGAVLNTVATIQRGDWQAAKIRLDEARRVLASDLSTSVSESYARAYHQIVTVEQLVELEEIAQLRQKHSANLRDDPSRYANLKEDIHRLRSLWDKRLNVCQKSVNVWQRLMAARILVVPPKEDLKSWIKFVSICRREERWGLARMTLKRLGVSDDYNVEDSLGKGTSKLAIFAALKLCWFGANDRPPAGDKHQAYQALQTLVQFVNVPSTNTTTENEENRALAVKCRLKLGEWGTFLYGDESREEAMRNVEAARKLEPNSFKAAHAWASLNYLQFESSQSPQYLIEAIRGFFASIALGRGEGGNTSIIMQDVLRLLTLWFDQSQKYPRAAQAIRDGIISKKVPIGTWLNVVPQLIARIQSSPTCLRELLVDLGSTYPQALVYPLTVAARSVDVTVSGAADGILSELRTTQAKLLDQAALVARELIRVAILLPEEWYEALEDACKAWYPVPSANEGDVRTEERARERYRALKATQECLADLNSRLGDHSGATRHEQEFLRKFGKNLERAAELVKLYEERKGYELPGKNRHMQDAWTEYKKIYHEIGEKYLKELSILELDDISPMLLIQRDLELAVPGTFRADVDRDQLITIKAFGSRVKVFPTKQRPRRLGLLGSNGFTYRYLLKGHEDLRQDERAMQLFGLVKALLNRATLKRDLSIHSYTVIPLSPHVGLIGWLPQTDTLHSLIRKYRAEKRIPLNIEQQWGNKISPLHINNNNNAAARDPSAPGNTEGYDRLTLIQKVEAFEYSLESTQGDDLAKVMWHKSRSAEVWLDRRTSFTRSLATMSMVGYILGLGDRHPSNLMIHRTSGRIVHIDFGDCFEVAMHREKYPERVPFRLTRMLVNAMEVSGIEGNFRISCETVMGILRDNRDSVMAMLEAFVHDPLISWRLLNIHADEEDNSKNEIEEVEQFLGRGDLHTVEEEDVNESMSSTTELKRQESQVLNMSYSSRAVPIPPRAKSRTESISESLAASKNMTSLSQSYRTRGVRAPRGRRFSIDPLPAALVDEPVLNKQAVNVVRRVRDKLTGHDFDTAESMNVVEQVDKLIRQATAHENLCCAFLGWCAFW